MRGVRKSEAQLHDGSVGIYATKRMGSSSSERRKAMGEDVWGGQVRNPVSTRYPSRDAEKAVGYLSLEFRERS